MVNRNPTQPDRNIVDVAARAVDDALHLIEAAFLDDPEAQRACAKEVADRIRAGMLARQQGLRR